MDHEHNQYDGMAFGEGYSAYLRGEDEGRNPYDLLREEEKHLSWNDGWMVARAERKEKGDG